MQIVLLFRYFALVMVSNWLWMYLCVYLCMYIIIMTHTFRECVCSLWHNFDVCLIVNRSEILFKLQSHNH